MSAGATAGGASIITVDANDKGCDSLEEEFQRRTSSLSESVLDYQYENGRRYHAYRQGKYLLPNDEQEKERLDITHQLYRLAFNDKLHFAPIEKPSRILDLCCGTGIWAIEMGDMFPEAEVLGNDLSPIQPNMVPPNVCFEISDVEDDWLYQAPFDYIHFRNLSGCISDFAKLIQQCYNNLAPGAWLECQECDIEPYSTDGTLTNEHAIKKLHDFWRSSCERMRLVANPVLLLPHLLETAGFQNINHKIIKMPFGLWPKDDSLKTLGAWNRLQFEAGCEGFVMASMTRNHGWNEQEVQAFLVDVRKDARNVNLHIQYDYHIFYCQKPL